LPNPEYQSQVLEEDKKRRHEEEVKKKKRNKQIEEAKKKKNEKKGDANKDTKKDSKKTDTKKDSSKKKDDKKSIDKNKKKKKSKSKIKNTLKHRMKTKLMEKEKQISKEMSEIMIQAQKDISEIGKSPIFGVREGEITVEKPNNDSLPKEDNNLSNSSTDSDKDWNPPNNNPLPEISKMFSQFKSNAFQSNQAPNPPTNKPENPKSRITIAKKVISKKPIDPAIKMNDWFQKNEGFDKWIPVENSRRSTRGKRDQPSNLNTNDPRVIEIMRDSINQELMDELAMMDIIRNKESNSNDRSYREFGFRGNIESIEGLKNGKNILKIFLIKQKHLKWIELISEDLEDLGGLIQIFWIFLVSQHSWEETIQISISRRGNLIKGILDIWE
jgi:hypothetical protein